MTSRVGADPIRLRPCPLLGLRDDLLSRVLAHHELVHDVQHVAIIDKGPEQDGGRAVPEVDAPDPCVAVASVCGRDDWGDVEIANMNFGREFRVDRIRTARPPAEHLRLPRFRANSTELLNGIVDLDEAAGAFGLALTIPPQRTGGA